MLPKERGFQLEYKRFASVKVDLTMRSSLQHAWFDVKGIFDQMSKTGLTNPYQASQLVQVSYLLKMADAEMSRIRASINVSDNSPADSPEMARSTRLEREEIGDGRIKKNSTQKHETPVDQERHEKFKTEIEQYILNDVVARKLDRIISDYYNTTLRYNEEFVDSIVDMFIQIRTSSIDAIKNEISHSGKTIIAMIKFIFGDTSITDMDNISKGSCLLILYYILIAKTGSVEIIKNSVGRYVNLHGTSPDDFANNLLFYYNKAAKLSAS